MRGVSASLLGRQSRGWLVWQGGEDVVVIVAGGAQGAINAEWKCKQRVWAFQLACGTQPQPRRSHLLCNTHTSKMSRLMADGVFKCYCHPAAASLLSVGATCEQTPWPHRSRPLRRPWRATSPASPRRSWATSWRTSTCATAATTYSDDRSRPSVDIASAPTASTGQ